MAFSKVANRLKLNSEASEDAIVSEIDRMFNLQTETEGKLTAALTEVSNKAKSLEEKEAELEKKKEEAKALATEIKQMKQKAEDDEKAKAKADAEEVEQKAKNLIEGFVKEGRIKNDAAIIANWTEKAKNDLPGVKALIEGLPINKVSAKLTIVNETVNKQPGSVVRNAMITKQLEMAKG